MYTDLVLVRYHLLTVYVYRVMAQYLIGTAVRAIKALFMRVHHYETDGALFGEDILPLRGLINPPVTAVDGKGLKV